MGERRDRKRRERGGGRKGRGERVRERVSESERVRERAYTRQGKVRL